jgi:pimeloyl-ACP methyl ester carboxylesterase
VNQFFNLLFGGRQRDKALFDFVTREAWQTDQSVMAHRFQMAEQMDLADLLPRIKVPTLVLAGDRDLLVSDHGLKELADRIPNALVSVIPGAGHLACVTHIPELVQHIHRFAAAQELLGVEI